MERNQKVVLLVLLLIILAGAGYVYTRKTNKIDTSQNSKAPAIKKTDAPQGQVVSGFPKELILDPKATTNQSYTVDYSKQNQYTVTLKSDMTPKAIFTAYSDYFKQNGYTVKNVNNALTTLTSIYAVKNNVEVNVVANVMPGQKNTDVTITYLKN
ncbi:MAG: hypothetical protein NVSMB66_5710 [Candidatus Doudnabacteria bacterium]